jgi:hypothetical protein
MAANRHKRREKKRNQTLFFSRRLCRFAAILQLYAAAFSAATAAS